jgi:hypothetical protein
LAREGVDSTVASIEVTPAVGKSRKRAALAGRWRPRRSHTPLADALFCVDASVGSDVISLFIGNRQFRGGVNGRKLGPEHWVSSFEPTLRFLSAELPVTYTFGVVHLPTAEDLKPSTASLRAAGKSV